MDKKRLLEHKINKLLEMFPVVAVVGPRQCGKSTLVQAIRPDWRYYDLERPDDYQLITSDPLGFFSRQRGNTIIDEALQFPDLFKVLRGVIDRDRKAVGRFLLTGSCSPEIDLIIDGPFGVIPVEVKLGHTVKQRMLTSLKIFIEDTGAPFGILVNNSDPRRIFVEEPCILCKK